MSGGASHGDDVQPSGANGTGRPVEPGHEGHRLLWIEAALFLLLIALSIIGVAVTDFATRRALDYWLAVLPVFAAVNIFLGWSKAKRREETVVWVLREQLLHWAALALAFCMVYLLQQTGRLDNESAGLVALLGLALTTFLAGVHFDWRFAGLGVLLGVLVLFAAVLEEYFWLATLVGAVGAVLILVWRHFEHRRSAAAP